MKTNTTLHRFDTKISTTISKFILILLVLSSAVAVGQTKCTADLRVEKDRNTRSTPTDGTYYSMQISNTGKAVDVYSLSAMNLTDCSNSDGSSSAKNVSLTAVILDKNLKPIDELKVNPGETMLFFVHMLVPKGTPFDKWNCTQITAKSKMCTTYKVHTILHTLVINPSEDN